MELDVAVLDNKGHFLPNIPKNNFRVLEDNVPQQIASFNVNSDAPMTIAMVIEFSNLYQQYYSQGWYETLVASYGFVQTLKPEDYVAVIAYDLRSEILCDFTTDRGKVQEAMQRLRIPGFSEANLFDALADTEQRMSNIEGRKAILLIASGRDTFSKLTYDKARKAVQEAGVPIYAISMLQAMRIMAEQYMSADPATGFPAGRQRDEDLRARERRPGVLPALLRRVPQHLSERFRGAAKSILAHLRALQSGQRRPIPQDQGGVGGSANRRRVENHGGRKAGEVQRGCESRVHGAARGGIIFTCTAVGVIALIEGSSLISSQALDLSTFQADRNSLTVPLQLC